MPSYDENGFLNGRIDSWIEENQAAHRDILDRANELNRDCHRFLDGRSIDSSDERQIVTCVLFARMVELYQSIIIVSERGMTTPSRILFRSFIEAFFHFSAIHKDSDYLKEYLDQLHIKRKRLTNSLRNSSSPELEGLRQSIDDQLVAEIKQAIEEDEIKEIKVKDSAERAGLLDIYKTVYAVLSSAVHTSASDLESHICFNKDTKEIEAFKYGPSVQETARAICLSGLWIAKALEIVSGIFDEDRKEICLSHTEAFQALLPEVNQKNTDLPK
jgi:Family of unknown function (DUF5677)